MLCQKLGRRRWTGPAAIPDGGPAGVWATARRKRKATQHGRSRSVTVHGQQAAREGCVWPVGKSERSVVPMKPGNAGGGKGPLFKSECPKW
jgi:hypothetical protein